jgi:hypothetical protein
MLDLKALALLPEDELTRVDIAVVNLSCAAGLPGGPTKAEAAECLKRLDEYATVARRYTEHCFPHFTRNPSDYRNSEGYFRTLCMVTVLWQRFGVVYNLAKLPLEVPLDTEDVFIHGAALGKGGTCASLPVFYAAVGRRLGYPIKLVATRSRECGHLFARWDDPKGERFNIEVCYDGMFSHPDDYYRTGHFHLSPKAEQNGGLLKSWTPRQELAGSLLGRANMWERHGFSRKRIDSMAWAAALAPETYFYPHWLNKAIQDWKNEMKPRTPTGFPPLSIHVAERRYPETLPLDYEKEIYGLEATENILNTPELDERWWRPMREGRYVPRPPRLAVVEFPRTQGCNISFRF